MTGTTDLQFDRAQFDPGAAVSPACVLCGRPLHTSYFEANGQPACERCCISLRKTRESGSGASGLIRATGAGLGAAIGGSVLYWAILAMTGYEFGLIAIAVGFAVGKAVHWGSGGRGGWAYQSLAIGLTYLSLAGGYVPLIIVEVLKHPAAESQPAGVDTAAAEALAPESAAPPDALALAKALAAIFAFAMAIPFLGGVEGILGLVIIGIGLYEAWKLNRIQPLEITGPHVLATAAPAFAGE